MSPVHEKDPLEGLGDQGDVFYKLKRVVFTEPLKANESVSEIGRLDHNNFTFLDKITIEKRIGRRNKYHVEIDSTTKPRCPESSCQKEFSSLPLLRTHIRRVHCAENNFVCEQCGARFSARYLLKRHVGVHEEKVQCPVCLKMLSKRTSLSVHLRSHGDVRPHECTVCGKRFVRKSTLNVHMRIHTLKCGKCSLRFESRDQLSVHRSSC